MSKEADAVKGLYFPVLDHGFVALVDYMGDDAAIVQAARCSYGAGTKKLSEDRDLIRYLLRHKHTTPFEMVELKFHVKLPIFVARQLIRHRTANVNEYSMRYSLPPMQFYIPGYDNTGTQSKKNKQGRAVPVSPEQYNQFRLQWEALQKNSVELYELMVSDGVDLARELARLHLPLSIYTEWYWKIDLHNLLGFLRLRVDKHAQWEIQQVSQLKARICNLVAPNATEAWVDYVHQAKTFSRMEMQVLREMLSVGMRSNPLEPEVSLPVLRSSGASVGMSALREGYKLGKREAEEFLALFEGSDEDPFAPFDLSLDTSVGKPGSYFEEIGKSFLPKQL
jgi:thymidylate synthase (FAD)